MNETIFSYLNGLALKSGFADVAVIFVAQFLIWWLVAVVIFLLLFSLARGKYADAKILFFVLVGAFVVWVISQGINIFFPVARPFIELPDANLLFEHGSYDSFPSGHATLAFALAFGLSYYRKSLAWIFTFGAILIGVSRVIAGVHWPLDVAGGFVLAIVTVTIMHYWFYNTLYEYIHKIRKTL